jgi:hypothetical protein
LDYRLPCLVEHTVAELLRQLLRRASKWSRAALAMTGSPAKIWAHSAKGLLEVMMVAAFFS